MDNTAKSCRMLVLMVNTFLFTVPLARADVVSDWSRTANDILVAAKAPYSRRRKRLVSSWPQNTYSHSSSTGGRYEVEERQRLTNRWT
jgi:hypothetical protein